MTHLDLCITLAPPPADAPEGTLASFELRCDALGRQRATGLLTDPLTAQERADLRWYLEEYWQWPYEQFVERARGIEGLLADIGQRLYNAVFASAAAQQIVQPWNLTPNVARQISIEGDISAALSLPWELLHDGRGFLPLRARAPVTIVRRLPEATLPALPVPFTPPLRVLLVTARPEGAGFVDPRGIARELLDEVQPEVARGAITLDFLRPATLPALRARLGDPNQPPVHILHFDGHGAFTEPVSGDGLRLSGGIGKLAFENDAGELHLVAANDLAQVLGDSGVKLAVLTACQSGMGSEDDVFSSVAAQLINSGIDAVVAMSASVLVASATRYVEAFYRALAGGQNAPLAHERARQALHDDPARHTHQRRRDEAGQPVTLRDWWLPHFYQQRPLTLQATAAPDAAATTTTLPAPAVSAATELPQPRYGFSGRAWELLQIERHLLRGKLLVLQGFGGVGKTTLAVEAADWLTRTGLYAGALFVSFEQGGGPAWLLAELGRHLGVYDGDYRPDDPAAALARLRPALHTRPTLLIADNLETILPNGDAPLDPSERNALWSVLLNLASIPSPSRLVTQASCQPCGVILTTRDTTFGDGRMAPGQRVAHLPLGGLAPADAYALATRLLDALGIERRRAAYAPLRDLLAQLDHHPLAIQLVLPALGELPLATLAADFASHLPRFADDNETGRNRSLLASLDYSLRRLTAAQRALLPRLALFEGGSFEVMLLQITAIPEDEWAGLRQGLEQAALIRAEQVAGWNVPFLHFHPVLSPFLRGQLAGEEADALEENYAQRYYSLSGYLYDEDKRNPQAVRALVRRELPNLRKALTLLITAGDLDTAVAMADNIARFLYAFGLLRERDALRQQVEQAVAARPASATLSQAEYLREDGLGEDEFSRGELQKAFERFRRLLARIESSPAGQPRGPGSYEHQLTLQSLARCLKVGGQPVAAEELLRAALGIIDALIDDAAADDNAVGAQHAAPLREYQRQRGALLTELGNVLTDQGNYAAARAAYEEALKVDETVGGEERGKGVVLGQLGTLALRQRDYAEAARRYREALDIAIVLAEPGLQAIFWHQLGMVAEELQQWAEAEGCYREALSLREQHSTPNEVAQTCNQLALVARGAGRPVEAEGWYRRALKNFEALHDQRSQAAVLNNLADLLQGEVRAGRMPAARLEEARAYAERALTIKERFDLSAQPWATLNILAQIAEQTGQTAQAAAYRRRARETFAAFAGNHWHIDQQWGEMIAAIVAAAGGDEQMRAAVEEALPQLEAKGWRIAAAIHRIWAGERDWHALAEDLNANQALLVKRVLEGLGVKG